MRRSADSWSSESEQAALTRLQAERPAVIIYTRQSRTDFDSDGNARGPSLQQQHDSVARRPELAGCPVEHFQDADRSGKETSKRPGYLKMIERIRSAEPGTIGAVAFYDGDRLHRSAPAFFAFMAEAEQRQILVFDASGLIRSEDELSWGIKAVVAQAERKKIARRVKDNLQYLKRGGRLLGHAPVGYGRKAGQLVLDPKAAPVVRSIFALYATGKYSLKTLARHLDESGVKALVNADFPKEPTRGWSHNLLKGLLGNPAYLGKVNINGKLEDGNHPALVTEELFERCQAVRTLHKRRTVASAYRLHAYMLTPLLRCARCGGRMHGRTKTGTTKLKKAYRYYQCVARSTGRCDAPWIRTEPIEQALRDALRELTPDAGLNEALRARLRQGIDKSADPKRALKIALKSLDERQARVTTMHEMGILDQAELVERVARINLERQAARQKAATASARHDDTWCERQIADLVRVWDLADDGQRARLLASIFERIEADTRKDFSLDVGPVPKAGWLPYFERVVNSPASCTQSSAQSWSGARVSTGSDGIRVSYRLTA